MEKRRPTSRDIARTAFADTSHDPLREVVEAATTYP